MYKNIENYVHTTSRSQKRNFSVLSEEYFVYHRIRLNMICRYV